MKKSVILNDSQVNRLQQTGTVVVVDMVKPQPYIDEKNHIKRGDINYGKTIWDEPAIENFTKCCSPYQPGSTLYVREKWYDSLSWDGEPGSTPSYLKQLSPATMPRSAARLFPVVDKVEVVRCKDVNALQRNNIGLLTTSSDSAIIEKLRHIMSFRDFITHRFGQSFWDGNGFIWLTTLKLVK